MKKRIYIITFLLCGLLLNGTYAENTQVQKYDLSDEAFKAFITIQKDNINNESSKVKPCESFIKRNVKKALGKSEKTYIYNEINYSENSATKNAFERINNPNYIEDTNLPNLYLGFTSNEKYLCNESFIKKASYTAIETAGKKILGKIAEKSISTVDYVGKIYDVINNKKIVDNTLINTLGSVLASRKERMVYISAGGNMYQTMYLSNTINGINTYKNIEKGNKKQEYELLMRNRLYSLYTCYINSKDKDQMKKCLKDFSNTVIKDKTINTKIKQKDLNELFKDKK